MMLEVAIDAALVRRLIAAQFPHWKNLAVRPVDFGGWDNRTFHLGDEMTVRLPSAAAYALQVEKEHRWLPRLAPLLPLPIPVPLAMGVPAEGYTWHWSVYGWIEGEIAKPERIANLSEFAADLARFLVALKQVDATDGPAPGQHNFFRGGPLTVYDGETRQAISALGSSIDAGAATAVWEIALAAAWESPPVWFHGDVSRGNLLVEKGRLSAVIDFGTSGVGDPSCDLAIAWTLFEGESRDTFRACLAADEATWARGRGWALWKALITAAGHIDVASAEIEESWRVIDAVLIDRERQA
ncbi:aminoglycoside phosphotransferase family protein [Mesorhizobium sp. B2-5-4]|nr:aminoglycoside phosphotransferase family protein [Mesorhizobium sp. B2-5-4]TPL98160.1 aminoglycoside phosphotransferase family protein [Mesorhizobium sp. B2-3-11]